MAVLRPLLSPWLTEQGFKRLGGRAWARPQGGGHLLIAVQAKQSGWDPRAGTGFIVEFELAQSPTLGTGLLRRRLWELLPEVRRREALEIINTVARTVPEPDRAFLAALPSQTRIHYLRAFEPTTDTINSGDVWFRYYDEHDAARWGEFLSRAIGPALEAFMANPHDLFHVLPSEDVQFPADLGAVVQRSVLHGVEPAREVIHTHDGLWLVADGVGDPNEPGAAIVTHMAHAVARNGSIRELVKLPPGHIARRDDPGHPWQISAWAGWADE